MGAPREESFLPGFISLAPSIHVRDKCHLRASSRPCSLQHPEAMRGSPAVVLLTSWTGAQARHVAKYTEAYGELYPHTPVMVVTTQITDLACQSTKQKMAALAAAVGFLQGRTGGGRAVGAAATVTGPPGVLLHAFSEGGSNKAVCVARAYLAATGRPLPVAAFVFDSTPGTPRFGCNVAAFRRSLPNNALARAFGLALGVAVLAATWVVFGLVVGFENNALSKTRRALNDAALWGGARALRRAPRTYLFSEADDLILWRDVEAHAAEAAAAAGVASLLVRYQASPHCGHARAHPDHYWAAVRHTWEARDVEAGDGEAGDGEARAGGGWQSGEKDLEKGLEKELRG